MWKDSAQPDRPQMRIWQMHIGCWLSKTTNTHSKYEILIVLPLQKYLQKCASMLRYTCIACIVVVYT